MIMSTTIAACKPDPARNQTGFVFGVPRILLRLERAGAFALAEA